MKMFKIIDNHFHIFRRQDDFEYDIYGGIRRCVKFQDSVITCLDNHNSLRFYYDNIFMFQIEKTSSDKERYIISTEKEEEGFLLHFIRVMLRNEYDKHSILETWFIYSMFKSYKNYIQIKIREESNLNIFTFRLDSPYKISHKPDVIFNFF